MKEKPKEHGYGADVTPRQYINLIIALCTGTLIEWFDFTVYSQLSGIITKSFFPANNPTTQQLAFWGVYATAFIARPIGSILFGHIGDAYGRRITMLASIISITMPTILIGCLPTYYQAGMVAPVLMAILRFVQGLAVGGEFGSAITYLYEVAPAPHRGVVASLGQQATAPGIILGIISCQVVLYACSPAQLDLWGWRIPFLLTAFFAPIALILRMHMPEPYEYLQNKQVVVLERVASTAASKVARQFTSKHSRSLSQSLSSRQLSLRLQSRTQVVITPTETLDEESGMAPTAAAGAVHAPEAVHAAVTDTIANKGSDHVSTQASSPTPSGPGSSLTKSPSGRRLLSGEMKLRVTLSGRHQNYVAPDAADDKAVAVLDHKQQLDLTDTAVPEEAEQEYIAEMQELGKQIKHHVPLVLLFKDHWRGVLLQFLLEANYGGTFYIFFSWLPAYLHSATSLQMQTILWSVLVGMCLFAIVVPLTGWAIDHGIRKVWSMMAVMTVQAAVCIPVLLALHSGSLVALWLPLPLMLGSCGILGGLMTGIGPCIYPSAVRASGYNLGHNLAMSLFGGLSPLMVSALGVVVKPTALAAGVICVLFSVVALCAAIPLIKVAPQTNARKVAALQTPPAVMISPVTSTNYRQCPSLGIKRSDTFDVIVV